MRRFILNFLLFFLISTTIILSLTIIVDSYINKKANFKLSDNCKYLIIGSSHPEGAFNDSIIRNLHNFSKGGEAYFYTFFKLQKITEQNPKIKTVFLEFSNGQILDSNMNAWIWEEPLISNKYPTFSPFMNISKKIFLFKHNYNGFTNSLSLSLFENTSRIIHSDYKFSMSPNVGGFSSLSRKMTESEVEKSNIQNQILYYQKNQNKISNAHINCLEEIVRFCKEHEIKLYLIRSPLPKFFPIYGNEYAFQKLKNEKFENIEYLDFSKFPLKTCEFGDLEHVNQDGAKIFSIWFNNLINLGLLNKPNKQEYINDKIKEIIDLK